jgi:hypothetical protein
VTSARLPAKGLLLLNGFPGGYRVKKNTIPWLVLEPYEDE